MNSLNIPADHLFSDIMLVSDIMHPPRPTKNSKQLLSAAGHAVSSAASRVARGFWGFTAGLSKTLRGSNVRIQTEEKGTELSSVRNSALLNQEMYEMHSPSDERDRKHLAPQPLSETRTRTPSTGSSSSTSSREHSTTSSSSSSDSEVEHATVPSAHGQSAVPTSPLSVLAQMTHLADVSDVSSNDSLLNRVAAETSHPAAPLISSITAVGGNVLVDVRDSTNLLQQAAEPSSSVNFLRQQAADRLNHQIDILRHTQRRLEQELIPLRDAVTSAERTYHAAYQEYNTAFFNRGGCCSNFGPEFVRSENALAALGQARQASQSKEAELADINNQLRNAQLSLEQLK